MRHSGEDVLPADEGLELLEDALGEIFRWALDVLNNFDKIDEHCS